MSEPLRPLAGRVALVSGASRGIGRAIAIRLGELGADVVVNYQSSPERAAEVVRSIEAIGVRALALQADMGKSAEVGAMVSRALEHFGHVDIAVHNAAVQRAALITAMTDEDWHTVLDVALGGAFFLARAVLPSMVAAKKGHLIHIGSISGSIALPQRGAANYIAAKHGLVGLTRALAMEVAPSGVLVNMVAPGVTDTDMIGALSDKQKDRLLEHVPMKRMARAEEIAQTVGWVAAYTTYSTGNVFHVSGGAVMD